VCAKRVMGGPVRVGERGGGGLVYFDVVCITLICNKTTSLLVQCIKRPLTSLASQTPPTPPASPAASGGFEAPEQASLDTAIQVHALYTRLVLVLEAQKNCLDAEALTTAFEAFATVVVTSTEHGENPDVVVLAQTTKAYSTRHIVPVNGRFNRTLRDVKIQRVATVSGDALAEGGDDTQFSRYNVEIACQHPLQKKYLTQDERMCIVTATQEFQEIASMALAEYSQFSRRIAPHKLYGGFVTLIGRVAQLQGITPYAVDLSSANVDALVGCESTWNALVEIPTEIETFCSDLECLVVGSCVLHEIPLWI